jgi:H+/Cl- antiporter ClcA
VISSIQPVSHPISAPVQFSFLSLHAKRILWIEANTLCGAAAGAALAVAYSLPVAAVAVGCGLTTVLISWMPLVFCLEILLPEQ